MMNVYKFFAASWFGLAMINVISARPIFAVDSLETRAAAGDVKAQVDLGAKYVKGDGVSKDDSKAAYWFKRAADAGFNRGQYDLGIMYLHGSGVPKDYAQAAALLEKSATSGLDVAAYQLGELYEGGWGVLQDWKKAEYWYKVAAGKGNLAAKKRLQSLQSQMKPTASEIDSASEKQIAMLQNSPPLVRYQQEERNNYLKAAETGDTNAMVRLGGLYESGIGVPKDYVIARNWYIKAAQKGSAEAEVHLGILYYAGQGIPIDFTQAREWYQRASDHGSAQATEALAELYFHGQGVRPDEAKAFELFKKSADGGFAWAQYELAQFYENGKLVNKDLGEAKRWYLKAAQQNVPGAREKVEQLGGGPISKLADKIALIQSWQIHRVVRLLPIGVFCALLMGGAIVLAIQRRSIAVWAAYVITIGMTYLSFWVHLSVLEARTVLLPNSVSKLPGESASALANFTAPYLNATLVLFGLTIVAALCLLFNLRLAFYVFVAALSYNVILRLSYFFLHGFPGTIPTNIGTAGIGWAIELLICVYLWAVVISPSKTKQGI